MSPEFSSAEPAPAIITALDADTSTSEEASTSLRITAIAPDTHAGDRLPTCDPTDVHHIEWGF